MPGPSTPNITSVDGGYLPQDVQGALNHALQGSGFPGATRQEFAPGDTPPGAFVGLIWDDGSMYGQRGWHINVLVSERTQLAAKA